MRSAVTPAGAGRAARALRDAIAVAAAMAMVTSGLEFVVHLVTRFVSDRVIYQGLDVIWAKPLSNLALFVPAGILLSRVPDRLFLSALAFPASAAPLLLLRPGSPLPMLILSVGLATQAGALLVPRARQASLRRTGVGLSLLFVAIAALGLGTRAWRERHMTYQVAPPSGAPNVLLIILDTVRGASLSMLGGRAETPGLESLAAGGVTFERAISPAPWTLPSHATLFTGLWPHEHGADWRTTLDGRAPTLAEVFARHGYRTGGFAANLIYTSREHGLDRGFGVYRDYRRSPGAILRAATLGQALMTTTLVRRVTGWYDIPGRKTASQVNGEFLDWEGGGDERPWFAFLNYFDAHSPWLPRAPFAGRYSQGLPPRRFDKHRFWSVEGGIGDWRSLSTGELAAEQAAYEEAISALDADLRDLVAELQRRGELDRTLVVVTSDHGELFGEHDTYSHGNSLYWRSVHVPLVLSWPGHVPAGLRVTSPVSLRDVPATILGLALPSARADLPGSSLVADRAGPVVLSEVSVEDFSRNDPPMRNGSLQSLVGADWQYLRAARGHEEVYDIGASWSDSLVADSTRRTAVVDTARARIRALRLPAPGPP